MRSIRTSRSGALLWIMVAPAVLFVAVFYVVPTILNLAYAFTDWSGFRSKVTFTGLQNFRDLLSDGSLSNVFANTLTFAVTVMVLQNAFALCLALALEGSSRVNGVLRAIFFVPVLLSPVAAGYVFRGFLAPAGPFNAAISILLGTSVDIQWFGSTSYTLFVVAAIHAWHWMGISMLIYIAGLHTIPHDLRDAARVEGATGWKVFRHIKMPLLAPALTFNLVITLIGSLSAFDLILATTSGGPGGSTEVLSIFLYRQFGNGFFGYATAINLVLLLFAIVVALPMIASLRRREVTL